MINFQPFVLYLFDNLKNILNKLFHKQYLCSRWLMAPSFITPAWKIVISIFFEKEIFKIKTGIISYPLACQHQLTYEISPGGCSTWDIEQSLLCPSLSQFQNVSTRHGHRYHPCSFVQEHV